MGRSASVRRRSAAARRAARAAALCAAAAGDANANVLSGNGGADALTGGGGIWSYTGTWSTMHTGLAVSSQTVYAIGGDPAGSVILAGTTAARVYQYQGSGAWNNISSNITGISGDVNGIWGSSATDIWLLTSSQLFHFNGNNWSQVTLPATPNGTMLDVFGTSSSEVYVVGRDMTIFRYDGTTWKNISTGCLSDLHQGSARGSLALFVGENGEIFRMQK